MATTTSTPVTLGTASTDVFTATVPVMITSILVSNTSGTTANASITLNIGGVDITYVPATTLLDGTVLDIDAKKKFLSAGDKVKGAASTGTAIKVCISYASE